MRDPDLVYRAERAAIALERAWSDWRVMHGAGTGPLPQITSYVGYSLTEPWGEPRVVLGVPADEAERLAALLEGHDCFGPVHAEVAGRPDWRSGTVGGPVDTGGPADAGGRSYDGPIDVPAQARGPEAGQFPASWQDLPRDSDSAAWDNAGRVRAARDSVTRERAARESVTRDRAARDRSDEDRDDSDLIGGRPGVPDDSAELPEEGLPEEGLPQVPWDFPAVPLLPVSDDAQPAPTRPASPAPAPAPAQGGPGYRGPRYLGSPPRYQPETDEDPVVDSPPAFGGQVRTDAAFSADVDSTEVAQARTTAGPAGNAAAEMTDGTDEDDSSWVDLGPAVSDIDGAIEAELMIEAGPTADAGPSADADLADVSMTAAAGHDAAGGLAAHADGAGTDGAGTDGAGTDGPGAASVGDGRAARKADRPAGREAGRPTRAAARKADRRTRSAAARADQPAEASAATADGPPPEFEPEPESDVPAAVVETGPDALTADEDAGRAATADSGEELPGAPAPGKSGRTRSRPVARLSRSRRSTPGAHEGSGWPSTGRTAKNSKV